MIFIFFKTVILDRLVEGPFPEADVLELGVDGRCALLIKFYDEAAAENGPFDFVKRQQVLSSLLDLLPIIWCDAKVGDLGTELLERLGEPILYLMRSIALEWFTSSFMRGIFVCRHFTIINFLFIAVESPYPEFPRSRLRWGFFRNFIIQSPVAVGGLPSMQYHDSHGDYSWSLVGRFEMVALTKKISIFGGGFMCSIPVSDPHMVCLLC